MEAQTQLNLAVEKERSASEKEVTLQSRVTALESQLAALRQERAQLLASLELERAKLESLEEGQQRWVPVWARFLSSLMPRRLYVGSSRGLS